MKAPLFNVTACPCCGNANLLPMLRAPDRQAAACTILHCATCCALVPDYPPDASIDVLSHQRLYHERYWSEESPEVTLREAEQVKRIVTFHQRKLDTFPKGTPMLDLGGGRGLLTNALLDAGYNAFGCEPSAGLVHRARTVLALPEDRYAHSDIASFVDQRSKNSEKAGAIFLWHVIEHLLNPLDQLKSIATLLRNDGIIIAQGPLLDPSYVFPEHRFLHCESNITWLAHELGMKVILLDSLSKERFISFALAKPDYPAEALKSVYLPNLIDASGALYFTLSRALELTASG